MLDIKENSLFDKVLYPKNKSKIPMWVHWTGRIGLILINIISAVYVYYIGMYITSLLLFILLAYQIAILFYGQEIRMWVLTKLMGRLF